MANCNIGEMVKNMESGVYDFTDNGKCIGCGECCTDILPLSDSEIRKIRHYVAKHHIKPHKMLIPTAMPTCDMTCPFLRLDAKTDRCMIYPVRPAICREFKCDLPRKKIEINKRVFHETRTACSVRRCFFGDGKPLDGELFSMLGMLKTK